MGKTIIKICLISARQLLIGTGFASSLLKHQWFAVGWIDPENKYCTTIDDSRSDNPLWRTNFITSLDDDDDDSKIQAALHVEVYSREPIFLTKKLHGTVTVSLKEFLAKFKNQSSVVEETRSYQLRRTNSIKPQGFVDVSVRISAERQDFGGFTGDFRGVMLSNNSGSSQPPFASLNQPNNPKPFSIPPDNHHSSMPNPLTNNASPQMQQSYYPPPPMQQPYYSPPQMQEPYYPPPPMQQPYYPSAPMQQPYYPPPPLIQEPYYPSAPMQPPPPPETWNAGYIPRSENAVNIPSSSSSSGGAGREYPRTRPGLGRDYMSGAEQDQKFSGSYTK
ncbi:vacuolar protein-sorting protein BRO1-like [Raphanus sativus]|uniref:Vacuolar protein-sorting protein BRO1-like n=1 Tax=Raphanus sativus TaxID=3726 RepID=A0A6J0MPD5_RAPSA|nr:vacuolar protein-sorting protein BRO1-like [Raphanus sativus]